MKHEQIDDLMISLPIEILDKIPPPPGFDQLPKDVQETIKKLSRDRVRHPFSHLLSSNQRISVSEMVG